MRSFSTRALMRRISRRSASESPSRQTNGSSTSKNRFATAASPATGRARPIARRRLGEVRERGAYLGDVDEIEYVLRSDAQPFAIGEAFERRPALLGVRAPTDRSLRSFDQLVARSQPHCRGIAEPVDHVGVPPQQ